MKVFISWSGAKSKAVAAALHEWIPGILNNAKPWMSDLDIEAGQDWNLRITGELTAAKFGIVCVTPENQERPWLNFEAGAISKQVNGDETRVAPLLIDFATPTDLTGPMTKFHSRLADEDGIRRLVHDMNAQLEDPLKEATLSRTFTALWPQLETQLLKIDNEHPGVRATRRDEREVVEEILTLVRGINTAIGTGSAGRRTPPSVSGTQLARITGDVLKAEDFPGRFMTSWDGTRLTVTTDAPLEESVRAHIRNAAAKSAPALAGVQFDVDPDELDKMDAYAEAYA